MIEFASLDFFSPLTEDCGLLRFSGVVQSLVFLNFISDDNLLASYFTFSGSSHDPLKMFLNFKVLQQLLLNVTGGSGSKTIKVNTNICISIVPNPRQNNPQQVQGKDLISIQFLALLILVYKTEIYLLLNFGVI